MPFISTSTASTLLPAPSKPLKILTIDGGGLQAISTLLILDKLLDTIANINGIANKRPRPCDVFDTIAGIGAGGWLAILLGRFHLDIAACLSEWYNITHAVAPRSKAEELRMRVFQKCYFDTDRLIEQVEELTAVYGTGENLIPNDSEGPRCRHVFVAALRTNPRDHRLEYNLFRTYECPKGAHVRDGPEDPKTYKIARAFAVTGAAKYFTPPWKEHMEKGVMAKFSDMGFPKPHNITELALDEMWGLYGKQVPISVVVNIGPGLPAQTEVKQIARRFSWGLSLAGRQPLPKRPRSPVAEDMAQNKRRAIQQPVNDNASSSIEVNSHRQSRIHFTEETQINDSSVERLAEGPKDKDPRINSFGSVFNREISEKLKRKESEIEEDIKTKLKTIYPVDTPPYFRLALEQSPLGTARNDSSAPGLAHKCTARYLDTHSAVITMEEIGRRISPAILAAAG